jgi:outer membrane lipoprotein-sorting protein
MRTGTLAGFVAAAGVIFNGAGARGAAQTVAWEDVVASYERVHDYTTTYEKEERAISNGEAQRIKLYFRKPLDVRMEWLDEKGAVDQIAVYQQDRNDGKLIARRHGMLGSVVGTMRLDIHDRRAMEDSRHPITEVGLGHVIAQASRAMRQGQAESKPPVEETVQGRRAVRFEIDGKAGAPLFGVAGARRATIWVDPERKLPIRVEIVDEAGGMLERHRFTDLRINVGLTDATFTLS